MDPNKLSYVLRKNYVNLKKGNITKNRYNSFIKKSYSYLSQPSFKNKKRTTKKEILLFKRLSK